MGIINFWISAFRLPKRCISELNGLCSSFLWSGPKLQHKAKISWSDVCKTKREGGLGLRSLEEAIKVSTLKLIWRLFSSKSLWSDWIKCYLIRKGSFWSVNETSSAGSWIWKKLLKIRPEALQFHRVKIGNGETTSYWHDAWSSLGHLFMRTGPRGPIDLGIPLNSTACEAFTNYHHRNQRTEILRAVSRVTNNGIANLRPQISDVHLWRNHMGAFKSYFDPKQTWTQTRRHFPHPTWNKAIWFPNATPKFSFLSWLATLNRLSTGERMKLWNPRGNYRCIFCGCLSETRNHLFFLCGFSSGIWRTIFGNLLTNGFNETWDYNINLLSHLQTSPTVAFLMRYAFQATLYHIWRERNQRRHGSLSSPQTRLIKLIDKTVRNRVCSITNHQNPIRKEGLHVWFSTR